MAGRPEKDVNEKQITDLRRLGMSWTRISRILGVSTKTVLRKRQSSSSIPNFTVVSDNQLDDYIREVLERCANSGERMITGALIAKGVFVQRNRIRESIKRVNPNPVNLNKRKIYRRKYSVPYPNALWHQDGNHKLIRWKLVIHGCIDGFSRLTVFLKCSPNNRAETVYGLFLEAIEAFRMPLKIRTDHGTENVEVARHMLHHHGIENNPVITGKSVHNQRIERLWRDVFANVLQKYYNLFGMMEDNFDLDVNKEVDMFSLHYIFIPRINRDLKDFQESWNNHPLSTEHNQSPMQVWTVGFYNQPHALDLTESELSEFGIDDDGPTPDIQTNNNVLVPEIDIDLSDDIIDYISQNIDPLSDDNNLGINTYCTLKSFLETSI